MKEIFIIKVECNKTKIVDELVAYTDIEDAEKHVKVYKDVYREDMNSRIYYDRLALRDSFTINGKPYNG